MNTAILYYSTHHGNTKMLLDAIAAENEVELIDVTKAGDQDLSGYARIGLASGIYYSNYAKPFLAYAERNLPEEGQGTCRDLRNTQRKIRGEEPGCESVRCVMEITKWRCGNIERCKKERKEKCF